MVANGLNAPMVFKVLKVPNSLEVLKRTMKIFRIFDKGQRHSFCCLPDTAMLNTKQPFFVPDFTQRCTAKLCLAVRITRLGRSIGEEFANRYYDAGALTLGVHFVASDLLETLAENGLPWDVAIGFDCAVAVAPQGNFLSSSEASMSVNEETYSVTISSETGKKVDAYVAEISLYYTLRQGDVLLLPLPLEEKQVSINDTLSLSLDKEKVLSFHIK